MLASSLKDRKLYEAYRDICLSESINDPKLSKMILDWKKKWINTTSNKSKVERALSAIGELLGDTIDNSDLIDKITSYMVLISKYVPDEASNELAEILKEI
jgi:hypothetical protein